MFRQQFQGILINFVFLETMNIKYYVQVKLSPTGHVDPEGSRRVKAPSFRDNGTVMVVGCQPTHRPPLPPGAFLMTGNTPGTHFC